MFSYFCIFSNNNFNPTSIPYEEPEELDNTIIDNFLNVPSVTSDLSDVSFDFLHLLQADSLHYLSDIHSDFTDTVGSLAGVEDILPIEIATDFIPPITINDI